MPCIMCAINGQLLNHLFLFQVSLRGVMFLGFAFSCYLPHTVIRRFSIQSSRGVG